MACSWLTHWRYDRGELRTASEENPGTHQPLTLSRLCDGCAPRSCRLARVIFPLGDSPQIPYKFLKIQEQQKRSIIRRMTTDQKKITQFAEIKSTRLESGIVLFD